MGARHVLGKHNSTVAARPVSYTVFPLIGPGGWQQLHLCPDAFITLAGRGRTSQREAELQVHPWSGGQDRKAREVALCAHPGPPEQVGRSRVDQMATQDKVVPHIMQGTIILKRHPLGVILYMWVLHEPVLKDRVKLLACAVPF